MTLTIEALRGVWRAQVDHRTEFGDTLEELLLKIAPNAPEEYVWHAAEVLGAILGAEVVEVPSLYRPHHTGEDYRELFAAMLPDTVYEEQWNPTPEQQEYFEDERTAEVEAFDPDTQPRGV